MGNSTSCSASAATLHPFYIALSICIYIVKMSFNANAIKKESEDSDDVIFIKQEVDLTQVSSSTHVSESKFGQL